MTGQREIRVWEPLVRSFHWLLAAAFLIAWQAGDELAGVHVWAGCAAAILVGLRIVWGFIGTRHAQFSDFVTPPRQAFAYAASVLRGTSRHLPWRCWWWSTCLACWQRVSSTARTWSGP